MVETIQWTDAGIVMIDQTRLPLIEEFVTCRTYQEVAQAITSTTAASISSILTSIASPID